MYVCMHAREYMRACACARVCVCVRACGCARVHIRTCAYVCAYVCELMSTYVFLSTLVDVETNQV